MEPPLHWVFLTTEPQSTEARMARRRTKKRPQRRRGRQSGLSYRHGLKEAIAKWLPGQFFSQWRVGRGVKWSALRLFWMAPLMAWSAEQTLQARFDATRDVLRALFPKWP